MTYETQRLLDSVRSREQAQAVIATLLQRFSSDAAYRTLKGEAQFAKQTVKEVATRTAGNLLTSFKTRKNTFTFPW